MTTWSVEWVSSAGYTSAFECPPKAKHSVALGLYDDSPASLRRTRRERQPAIANNGQRTNVDERADSLRASRKSTSEARLVEVLDAYLAAAQEGIAPAREELLADHPELAEDLEACLASLEFIRQASLTAPPLVVDSKAIEPDEGEPGLGDLGDFRISREIGRGGMGVVYEAVQRSLNRRVALKVLPFAAAMDPTQLRRFQTEALAAAQLHHTHIVPVYSVGCERGVHYYAMQFIEGQTLAKAIAERRLHGGAAARLGRALPSPPRGKVARRAG